MSVYWNDCRRDLRDHNLLGLWALATLLAAVSGPLGSYENCTFLHRLLLWGIWLGLFLLASTGIRAFVLRVLNLREFSRAGPLIAALVAMLISFPVNAMNAQTVLNGDTGPFITASWGEIAAMVFLLLFGNDVREDFNYMQVATRDERGWPTAIAGPSDGWVLTRWLPEPLSARYSTS